VTSHGRQLAVETQGESETTNVWIEDVGPPITPCRFQLYAADKTRTSALSSVAPRLSGPGYSKPPQRAYKILVTKESELNGLLDWYSGIDSPQPIQLKEKESSMAANEMRGPRCLNAILYGPPGTGKTYSTVLKAMAIVDGVEYPDSVSPEVYQGLKLRFDELLAAQQIALVTFHQSYGYEDFVEGIRPRVENNQVTYEVRPGVLKRIAKRAELNWSLSGADRQGSAAADWEFSRALAQLQQVMEAGDDVQMKLYTGGRTNVSLSDDGRQLEFKAPTTGKPWSVSVAQLRSLWPDRSRFATPADIGGFLSSYLWSSLRLLQSYVPTNEQQPSHEELKPHILIIDEINRGNISKVFGELITLVEEDKRLGQPFETRVFLPYSQDAEPPFGLPPNLHIIGTMNTADRSIALVDIALRRRFHFLEMMPKPEYLGAVDGVDLNRLLTAINARIEALDSRDHALGHAYLLGVGSLDELDSVFRRKVLPLLQEYFYENWGNVRAVLNDTSHGSFVDLAASPVFKEEAGSLEMRELRPLYRINPSPFGIEAFRRIYEG
jgi:5-methylcytosine-specific restriction protein B